MKGKLFWLALPVLGMALTGVVALGQGRVEREAPKEADKAEVAEKVEKAKIGEAAPDFTLTNAKGEEVKLSSHKGKVIVLEWINFDCPWVKAHYDGKDETITMQNKAREDGVVWLYICSSSKGTQGHFEGDALTERIKKEKLDAAHYLIDEDGKVGRMYDAKVTPHMYVIDKEGKLRYAGAMDNLPAQRRGAEAENYVQPVLDALKKGEEITVTERKPYGCTVKYRN